MDTKAVGDLSGSFFNGSTIFVGVSEKFSIKKTHKLLYLLHLN
ncbi:hypothetical protein [Salimicrobium humidisoli]|nr:hypothetical protein [Salimicrobium humidisoli]